jgi:hypothetical protein
MGPRRRPEAEAGAPAAGRADEALNEGAPDEALNEGALTEALNEGALTRR